MVFFAVNRESTRGAPEPPQICQESWLYERLISYEEELEEAANELYSSLLKKLSSRAKDIIYYQSLATSL